MNSSPSNPESRCAPPSWLRWTTTLLLVVAAALTTYYTTLNGLRIALNEKADRATVERIDNRLVAIETILRTDVVQSDDLNDLRAMVDRRLTRIETMLEGRSQAP